MAWDDDLPDWIDWTDAQEHAYEVAFNAPDEVLSDPFVLGMFEDAFIRHMDEAEQALIEYLYENYDLIWEDVWDWEAWREAYGEAA